MVANDFTFSINRQPCTKEQLVHGKICTTKFFIAMEKADQGLIYMDRNEDGS